MYNHAVLKYTLEVIIYSRGTECSSKTHYNLLRLFDCCIKISFGFLCVIEESKHLFLWLSSTGINLPDIIARQFLDCSLALNFFRFFSPSKEPFRISSFCSPHLSRIHTRNLSLSFSLWFHLHIYNFFLVPFVFKKTFSGPFFSLEILAFASNIHSDSRYLFANERRAFFHIYLLPHSLLHILIIIHTRKTCLFLLFFLLFSTFFSISLRHSFYVESLLLLILFLPRETHWHYKRAKQNMI